MDIIPFRLEHERYFHDRWAESLDPEKVEVYKAFEGCTAPENRFILSMLGPLTGKRILDLGCGAGENGVYFALHGAECLVADYAPGMVKAALALAEYHGVKIEGRCLDAMAIDCPDECFDIVYAANLLHHVDPESALREIHRVLKKGGKACFWDPLRHNPVINVYRRIATEVRSKDEQPLDINIISFVNNLFSETSYDTFWLATLWIFIRFYLIERINPNKERYWKKILTDEPRLRPIYKKLEYLDFWLKKVPLFRKYAWNLAVVATK